MNENQNINSSKSNKKIFILVGGLLILLIIIICIFAVVNKDDSNGNSGNNNQENSDNGNNDFGEETGSSNVGDESKFRQVTVGNLSFEVSREFKNGGANNEVYQMYNYMTDTEFCKLTITQNKLSSTITPKNYYKSYYNSVLTDNDLNNLKTEKINNATWNTIEVDGYGEYTDYYYLYIDKDNNAYDIHYEIYSGKTKCDNFFKDIKESLKMK